MRRSVHKALRPAKVLDKELSPKEKKLKELDAIWAAKKAEGKIIEAVREEPKKVAKKTKKKAK